MGFLDSIGSVFQKLAPVVSVVSPIAGAAASLVGAIGSNKAQKAANEQNLQIARENNETSIQIARENNEFARQHAIDMFNMENTYNTPLAQMERFREAGLNPAVMMEGVGSAASGNSSGAGMVSPSMPTLSTPHMDAVPPMSMGFLDALSKISQIRLINANAKKVGAEENRINTLLDEEVLNMIADRNWKDVQADYQSLMTRFEELYGHDKRAADLQKTISDFLKNKMQGNEAAARAALVKAEEELTKSKNKQLQLESPILIENLKKLGVKLDEEAKTERSKQSVNYSSAAHTDEIRRLLKDQHDDLVRGEKYKAAKQEQEYREMILSSHDRLERLYSEGVVTKMQIDELREAIDLAKKKNDWYHWNEAFDKLERINRGVNAWFSVTNY